MDDFLLYFACGASLLSPAVISQHIWAQFALVVVFHGRNILVKSLCVLIALPQDFLGRSLTDS
jgi:hypothetical protein